MKKEFIFVVTVKTKWKGIENKRVLRFGKKLDAIEFYERLFNKGLNVSIRTEKKNG